MSKITLKLMQQLQQSPREPLLKDEATQQWYSGGELAADVDQLKDQLKGLKVGHGDVVLVALPNSAVYPVLIQAIWELGAVVLPVASDITPAGLQALLHQRAFAACVVAPELQNAATTAMTTVTRLQLNTAPELTLIRQLAVPGHVAATPTEADAALILTLPQASSPVSLTFAQLGHDVTAAITQNQLTAQDRTLLVTRLHHVDAQVALLATRLVGAPIVVTPHFTASQFWPQIQANEITHVALHAQRVTTLLKTLALASPAGHLRFMPVAAPALPRPAPRYQVPQTESVHHLFINLAKKSIMKGDDARRSVNWLPTPLSGAVPKTG